MLDFTYETRYGDYKNFDVIKPSSIMDMVQDVSTKASESCGYGIEKLRSLNIAWLLRGIKIHFEKPVKTHTPIKFETSVKSIKAASSQRGCIGYQDGECVVKTVADWFIFDTQKLRPSKIPQEIIDAYDYSDFGGDEFFNYVKPKTEDIDVPLYTVRVSNKELDTNMHLNNEKSAEILMDALPFDYYFTDAVILYKKPAYLGDELELCMKETEKGYYVHLQTRDKEICVAGIFE